MSNLNYISINKHLQCEKHLKEFFLKFKMKMNIKTGRCEMRVD